MMISRPFCICMQLTSFSLEKYGIKYSLPFLILHIKIITTGVWTLISMLQRDHYFRRLGAKNFTLSLWCISLGSLLFRARAKWKWWTARDVRVAHGKTACAIIYVCSGGAYAHTSFHFCRAELKFRPCRRLGARNSRLPTKVARDIMGLPKVSARGFSPRTVIYCLEPGIHHHANEMRTGLFPFVWTQISQNAQKITGGKSLNS